MGRLSEIVPLLNPSDSDDSRKGVEYTPKYSVPRKRAACELAQDLRTAYVLQMGVGWNIFFMVEFNVWYGAPARKFKRISQIQEPRW